MNKVVLIGRLTKDPDLRYTQSGKAVCNFTLAVNRPFKSNGEQDADFINIVIWNKPAENTAKYMGKGGQCAVEGRLQVRNYRNDSGEKRYITEVVANSIEFLSYQNDTNNQDTTMDDGFYVPEENPFNDFRDEELPF